MKLLKTLVLSAIIVTPMQALAIGGNDPIEGIDIIIKKNPGSSKPIFFRFGGDALEKYNGMKAKSRANYLSKIVATKALKLSGDKQPRGGWQKSIQARLAKEWCGPCKLANFTMKTSIEKTNYAISFKLKPSKATPVITKMKAKAATKTMIKKK